MKYRDLTDFWPVFIEAHLHPWNRRFHLIGNAVMISCWITAAITLNPYWLLAALLGYVPSWLGHLFFEGKEPPTLGYPVISGLANFKLVGLILSGTLPAELERLFGTASPATGSTVVVSQSQEREYQEKLRYYIGAKYPRHPFTNYWEIFVMKHQRPMNVWVHVIAMFFLYGIITASIYFRNWQLLFAIPISQGMGLISHNTVERTHIDFQDAIFSPRAFYCLNRMMVGVVTGSYWRELARVQNELALYLRTKS